MIKKLVELRRAIEDIPTSSAKKKARASALCRDLEAAVEAPKPKAKKGGGGSTYAN